jgi:hypothetical protein
MQNALRWIQLGELWVGVLKSRIDLGSRMLYEVCGYGGIHQVRQEMPRPNLCVTAN